MYEINDGILPEQLSQSKHDCNNVNPTPVVIFHGNVFSTSQKKEQTTFENIVNDFVSGNHYPFKTEFYEARNLFLAEGKSKNYKSVKKKLPFFLPHVSTFYNYNLKKGFRALANFRQLSGIFFLEIDFYDEKTDNRKQAIDRTLELFNLIKSGKFPLIYSAWISTSSSGVALFIKGDKMHRNNFDYELKRIAKHLEEELQLKKKYKTGFDDDTMQLHQPCFIPIHEERFLNPFPEIWKTDPNPPPIQIKVKSTGLKTDPDLKGKLDDGLFNYYLNDLFDQGIYRKYDILSSDTGERLLYSPELKYDFDKHELSKCKSSDAGEIKFLCPLHNEDITLGILPKEKHTACIRFDIKKDFRLEKSKACNTIQRIISEFYFIECLIGKRRKMNKSDIYHMAQVLNSRCYSTEKKYDPLNEDRIIHITCTVMEAIKNNSLYLILRENKTLVDYKPFLNKYNDADKKNIGLLIGKEVKRIQNNHKKNNFIFHSKEQLDKLVTENKYESKTQLTKILSPILNLKLSTINSKLSRKEYASILFTPPLKPISAEKQNVALNVAPNESTKKIERTISKLMKTGKKISKPVLSSMTGISERHIGRLWKPMYGMIQEHNERITAKIFRPKFEHKIIQRSTIKSPDVQDLFFTNKYSASSVMKLVIKDDALLVDELNKIRLKQYFNKVWIAPFLIETG